MLAIGSSIRLSFDYVVKKSSNLIQFIFQSPKELHNFLTNISDKFGWHFVIMCFTVYGVSQGLGEGWFYPAQNYYYLDVMKLTAIQAASYTVVTHTPWTIKPIYGILSDCFPILGYHRSSYTTLSSGIGTICWIFVAIFYFPTDLIVILLLFFGNYSLACPEVMVDAVVAERSKRYPDFASPLQSFNYGCLAFLAIFGTLSSGFLITSIGPKALFGLVTITSVSVFIPSILSFLGEGKKTYIFEQDDSKYAAESQCYSIESNEERLLGKDDVNSKYINTANTTEHIVVDVDSNHSSEARIDVDTNHSSEARIDVIDEQQSHHQGRLLSFHDDEVIFLEDSPIYKCSCRSRCRGGEHIPTTNKQLSNHQCILTFELFKRQSSFAKVGIVVSFLVLIVAVTIAATQTIYITAPITFSVVVIICLVLYAFLYSKFSILVKATIFLFLRECLQPNVDTAFFYWYVNADNGPKFSPEFVGYINTMAYVAMLLGIVVYSIWLRNWSYRNIFTLVQIVLVFTNLLDLCLVARINISIGIPDAVFILGDSTIGPVVKRLYLMPMYVMASKLCPDGAEATLFSIIMSLSNFGYDVGTVFGTILLTIFHVTEDNWSGFIYVLAIKSIMRLLPILFIPFLVPLGTPEDPPDIMFGIKIDNEVDNKSDHYITIDNKSDHYISSNHKSDCTYSTVHNRDE